jgi:pilus assembly protein CpaB
MLKGKTPVIIALVLAAMASGLVYFQLRSHRNALVEKWKPVDVVVAKKDLQAGARLENDAVDVDQMPERFVYDSVLVPNDLEVASGQEVVVPIKRGEPIHWYQLRGARSVERLAKTVSEGRRAVTIDVSERTSVGQWVRPNDRIDILGTFRDPRTNQMVAITLLQDVIVLATGHTSGSTQGTVADMRYATVTLQVSPDEAEVLTLAQDLGSLNLTLRNPGDNSIFEESPPADIETLLLGVRKGPKKKRTRRKPTDKGPKIIRGIPGSPDKSGWRR